MNELLRARQWVLLQLYVNAGLQVAGWAAGAGLITAVLFDNYLITYVLTVLVGVWAAGKTGFFQPKKARAMVVLHQRVGATEYSLDLLDKPAPNVVEQLQLARLGAQSAGLRPPFMLLTGLTWPALGVLAGLLFYVGWPLLGRSFAANQPSRSQLANLKSTPEKRALPRLESARLMIIPPAYTQLPARESADLNAQALMGSRLTWRLRFSQSAGRTAGLRVMLVGQSGTVQAFQRERDGERDANLFRLQDQLTGSGLYSIRAMLNDSIIYQSPSYRLESQPDLSARIEPDSRDLYQFHRLSDPKTRQLSARVSDDFGVQRVYIVATLARGSGENVKFREARFALPQTNFRTARLSHALDLAALGFAPGDELYYRWVAIDNCQPTPNISQSDTYFLVFKDTTRQDEAGLATMAMNVMPAYFRSQRQIIIDTDKLIAGRKRLTEKSFQSQSNEIGFDQRALRLRYGQYLGEEFEASIGGGDRPPGESVPETAGGDLLNGFRHDHDTGEGEHEGHEAEAEPAHDHDHGPTNADADPVAALLADYVHNHDNGEVNTFYEQSTRSLLKMALEQMWQSELHLRLFEPEKARPFEQKALTYLKLAQQKARTFVRKSSAEPPPIREKETRLTGERKNVSATVRQQGQYDRVRTEMLAARVLGFLTDKDLTPAQRQTARQLSSQVAAQPTDTGLPDWLLLTGLVKLSDGKSLTVNEKNKLSARIARLVGPVGAAPPVLGSAPTLERAFWKNLR